MLYRVSELGKSDYFKDEACYGDLLLKDFGSGNDASFYSNVIGTYADAMLVLSKSKLDNDFAMVVYRIVRTIEILATTRYDGDYVKYVNTVRNRLMRVSRGSIEVYALQKYKDMWKLYEEGDDVSKYQLGIESNRGNGDVIVYFQECISNLKVSNSRRMGDFDEYWLSDRYDIDIEYANAINALIGLLVYIHNSESYRSGVLEVFDKVEFFQRYEYAMYIANIPYRRIRYATQKENRG